MTGRKCRYYLTNINRCERKKILQNMHLWYAFLFFYLNFKQGFLYIYEI